MRSPTASTRAKRLPTGAELDAFRPQPGVTLGGVPGTLEWTGDIFDDDRARALTDPGLRGNQDQSATNTRYRCVR